MQARNVLIRFISLWLGLCLWGSYGVVSTAVAGTSQSLAKARAISTKAHCGRDVVSLIQAWREVVQLDQKNNEARQMLAEIAWKCAAEIEFAESINNSARARNVANIVRKRIPDVLWRTGYEAKHGNGSALLTMAVFHRLGILSRRSSQMACDYYKRAMNHGIGSASYRYGLCVVDKDKVKAMKYNRQAANANHAAAQHLLGEYMLHGSNKDEEKARYWIEKSALQKRTNAQTLLGWMYVTGTGGDTDIEKARQLYTAAAKKGDPVAQNNLGELFEKEGGSDSIRSAAHWYDRSARNGTPAAQLNLGRLYATGNGVPQNNCKALKLLKKAKVNGQQEAVEAIRWMEESGQACQK